MYVWFNLLNLALFVEAMMTINSIVYKAECMTVIGATIEGINTCPRNITKGTWGR